MIDDLRSFNAELPEGWRWAKLGQLARFINGDRGKNYPSPTDRVCSGVPFINTGHIDSNGRLNRDRMEYIARETFEKLGSGKVCRGDIVYCLRGSTIGKVARNEFAEGAIASSLIIIRSGNPYLQSFIYHYLSSSVGQRLARTFDNGSAQPNLSARVLANYPIPLPPQADLTRMCELLGALDDKIELSRQMNETLEAMARAIFEDWFVDFGPTRAKMEGRAPYLAPDLWSLFPGRLNGEHKPEGWKIVPLGQCCSAIFSGGTPSTTVAEFWGGDVPWLSSGETRNLVVTKTERSITQAGVDNSSTRLATKGSAVIASAGQGNTRGQTAFLARDMYINQSIIALKADKLVTTDALLFLDVNRRYDQFRQISDSNSSRGSLTTKMVASLPSVVPPLELIRQADSCVSPLLNRIVANDFESRTLAAIRDLLLPKLMSGEIRVKDADRLVGEVA